MPPLSRLAFLLRIPNPAQVAMTDTSDRRPPGSKTGDKTGPKTGDRPNEQGRADAPSEGLDVAARGARLLRTGVIRRACVFGDRGPSKTRPPVRPTRTVAAPIQKAAGTVLKGHRKPERELAAAWREIVGDTLGHMTRPEHYQPGQGAANNGVLTVRVAGAFGLDIQHLEPQIIERVNGYFGYRAIARLKIVQGPLPGAAEPLTQTRPRPLGPEDKASIAACSKDVSDPGLRKALEMLGQDLFTRTPKGDPSA